MKAALVTLCAALAAAAPELAPRQATYSSPPSQYTYTPPPPAPAPAPPSPHSSVCSGSTLTDYDIITINPAPRKIPCNLRGTLASPSPLSSLNTCSASTLNTCRDTCISNTGCQSFSYDSSTQVCNLYSKTLANQHFVRSFKGTTDPPFFQRQCFEQVYSGNYVQNGDFENPTKNNTDSNIHVADWSVTKAAGAHAAQVAYATVPNTGSYSLSMKCPLTAAKTGCHFNLIQNIAGPSSPGAYKLVFSAAATALDNPAVNPTIGVRMTPYFNNYMADRGTLYAFPCAKHEHCAANPSGMTWYPFDSLWYSTAEKSAPLRFAVSMPAGYRIYFDDVSFEFEGESLPPQKRAVDVSIRRISA